MTLLNARDGPLELARLNDPSFDVRSREVQLSRLVASRRTALFPLTGMINVARSQFESAQRAAHWQQRSRLAAEIEAGMPLHKN